MYQEYSPDIRLSHLVECYWTFSGYIEEELTSRILPDGCVDVIVSFRNDSVQSAMRPLLPYLVGTTTGYIELSYTKHVDMLGIRFNPAGITAFTRVPIYELTNLNVELSQVESLFDKHFFELLPEKKKTEERIAYINDYLIDKMCDVFNLDVPIIVAANRIKQANGNISIEELSKQSCLCQRQLERRFKSAIGISPKAFSRIAKFRNAVHLLRTNPKQSLYSTALDCGYYDHAHLIKEFKALSGNTPSVYMQ